MSLARIIVIGLGVVSAAAYIGWQIYRRRQLSTYSNVTYVNGKAAYFTPRDDGTVSEEECAICLDTMTIIHKVHMLPCNHTYHENCIEMWARYDRTCPLCRTAFLVQSR